MKLQIFIQGQTLNAYLPQVMVADTVNYFRADFVFKDEAWKNLTKYAHFQLGEECYDIPLQNDRIPESAGLNLKAGSWSMHIHGDRFEDGELVQRITTNACFFTVQESGCLDGSAFPSVPPDLAAELLARVAELEQNGGSGGTGADGKSAYEIALEHGFEGSEQEWLESLNGEDGKDGKDGVDGQNGKDGVDGYTPIKGIDYFDGSDGKDGQNGQDGKTPIKGVDYFTEADKQEIAEQAAQLVEVPEGGSGGEWEVLTDITLAEDATVAEITYDSKYKELYGEIIMPKVPAEINTSNSCVFLGAPLYHVKIGGVTYSYVIQAYVNIVTEKSPFLICRVKEDSGAGMKAELVTRSGVQSLINEMRMCKFRLALPAGTTIKVYGRE